MGHRLNGISNYGIGFNSIKLRPPLPSDFDIPTYLAVRGVSACALAVNNGLPLTASILPHGFNCTSNVVRIAQHKSNDYCIWVNPTTCQGPLLPPPPPPPPPTSRHHLRSPTKAACLLRKFTHTSYAHRCLNLD